MKSRPALLLFLSTLLLLVLGYGPATGKQVSPKGNRHLAAEQDRSGRMADNFFIIYDPSTTMAVPYRDTGLTRIEAQKSILRRSNASLPELNWQAGLYPHWKGELWLHGSPMAFRPYYRLQQYRKADFSAAIEQLPITAQSPPMLQTGLMKLDHLLGLAGRTEVFLFSDGHHSTFKGLERPPLALTRELAAKYDVCFNIISSAVDTRARQLLADMAAVNSCSQLIDFDAVYDRPEHLLGKLYRDTRDNGFAPILFDFDQARIKPEALAQLDRLGQLLVANPHQDLVLSGFTDSIGTEAYNKRLSQRRAEAVGQYLQARFGISRDRILLYWYGPATPVAANDSPEGRRQNRRVTIVLRGQ